MIKIKESVSKSTLEERFQKFVGYPICKKTYEAIYNEVLQFYYNLSVESHGSAPVPSSACIRSMVLDTIPELRSILDDEDLA